MTRATIALVAVALLTACPGGGPDESASAPASASAATSSASPSATPPPGPTSTASPTAEPTPTPVEAGTYIALGDSLAVGAGATAPADLGYVGRLYAALRAPDATPRAEALVNLAIGGETSTSMIRDGQLAAALDAIGEASPPVALVTLDIGGNDLLRLLGTETCQAAPLGQDCLALLALTLDDFEANFRQILEELTAALDAHAPDADLAVMTYFNPFSGTDAAYEAAAELALLGSDERIACDVPEPQARGMNDIIACVADEVRAVAVDVQPAFTGAGLELTHIGSEDIHANDRGYEVIAEAFLDALRR